MNVKTRPEYTLAALVESYQRGCDDFAMKNPASVALAMAKGEQCDDEHAFGLLEAVHSFCLAAGIQVNVTTDEGILLQ